MKLARWLTLPLMVMLAASCSTPRPTPSDDRKLAWTGLSRHEMHDGRHERYYLMYVPGNLDLRNTIPVILALHGGGGSPEHFAKLTGFNNLADNQGFVVVYPSGTGVGVRRLFWNVLLTDTYATRENIDDLAFIKSVISDVKDRLVLPSLKFYATGFSQGGMLCFRMACDEELSSQIVAIATVGATMTVSSDDCRSIVPFPILAIHGDADPFNSYQGGVSERAPRHDRVARPGFNETIEFWISRNNVSAASGKKYSQGGLRTEAFSNQEGVPLVVACTIEGGGHVWPGSNENLPVWLVGKTSRDINATPMIWNFFKRF
ncbi:MAG TPA: alpha/beta fold hydrolase [Kiritimatiellia bacterium]|nr:alpha/beta fold hydrolase [Kiritimatiellia bacterium]